MLGANAELCEGLFVGGGAVADVLFETVARVFLGEINHVVITSDFGDDGGGGDFFDE